MSKKLKILIVEDEFLTVRQLRKTLESYNYEVVADALNVEEALCFLKSKEIDLVLLDINLKGDKDGVYLADIINEEYTIPFVFLTAYSTPDIMNKAMDAKPGAYLIKPFSREELYTAIEIALSKTAEESKAEVIYLKEDDSFIRLKIKDILVLESEKNYVKFHTKNDVYKHRCSMKDIIKKLPKDVFIRTHRAFCVNSTKVEKYNSETIFINGLEIPVSRSYKNDVSNKFQ